MGCKSQTWQENDNILEKVSASTSVQYSFPHSLQWSIFPDADSLILELAIFKVE